MPEVNNQEVQDDNVNQDPNAIGMSDHDKEMIALSEARERGEDVPAKEGEEEKDTNRPEWLPEKFKSVEDMAKAYAELEKKQGGKQDESTEDAEESDKDSEDKDSEDGAKITSEDMETFNDEFYSTGDLSKESYEKLEAKGFNKEMTEIYMEGLRMRSEATAKDFYEIAGDKENFDKINQWVAKEGESAITKAYNAAIQSQDVETAKGLFEVIVGNYKKATGYEGSRAKGTPESTSGETFESVAEMVAAMNDPRYTGQGQRVDTAYVQMVEQKLGRSNLF